MVSDMVVGCINTLGKIACGIFIAGAAISGKTESIIGGIIIALAYIGLDVWSIYKEHANDN